MGTVAATRVGCEFDRFLYASVCEDGNGMPLTVLSALARSDVDPWEEAAKLAHLSQAGAARQLAASLAALRNVSVADRDLANLAVTLVALLPRSGDCAHSPLRTFARLPPAECPTMMRSALSLLTFVVFMLFSNWLMGNLQASKQKQIQSAATASPTIDTPAADEAIPTPRGAP